RLAQMLSRNGVVGFPGLAVPSTPTLLKQPLVGEEREHAEGLPDQTAAIIAKVDKVTFCGRVLLQSFLHLVGSVLRAEGSYLDVEDVVGQHSRRNHVGLRSLLSGRCRDVGVLVVGVLVTQGVQ